MYGYIGKNNGSFYFVNDSTIHIFDEETKQKTALHHDCKFLFVKNNIFIDSLKRVYTLESKLLLLAKINKNISNLQKINDDVFFTDRFGDIYKIDKKVIMFLFGSMCFSTSICVDNSIFYVGDKYGRIRKCTEDGKIEKILFLGDPILDLQIYNDKLFILQRSRISILFGDVKKCFELDFGLKLIKEDDGLLILCKKNIWKYDENDTLTLLTKHEGFLDVRFIGESIIGLTNNGKVIYAGESLYEFNTIYSTNHDLIMQ